MDAEIHMQIALIAYKLGLLRLETFAQALVLIGEKGKIDPNELWVGKCGLTRDELVDVMLKVEGISNSSNVINGQISSVKALESAFKQEHDTDLSSPAFNDVDAAERDDIGPGSAPTMLAAQSSEKLAIPLERASPMPDDPRYHIVGDLGVGGMAKILTCFDNRLQRKVAIKTVKPEIRFSSLTFQMLEREGRIVSRLEHPNIIPVYDAGQLEDGSPYYAMRLLEQSTLADILVKLRVQDNATTSEYGLQRLLRYFMQICDAIDYAHSRGIIHCDLKPSNIVLGSFGDILVVDWGLAHSMDEKLTFRGGTPAYMAPEQRNPAVLGFDARTDVFALGAILYEILCLYPPFADKALSHLLTTTDTPNDRPLLIPPSTVAPHLQVPPEIEEIAMKAMSYQPDQRYPSARALADDLERFLAGTKEKEMRLQRAVEFTQQGKELSASYQEMNHSNTEHLEELATIRSQIAPWDSEETKQVLWQAEERLQVMESIGIRTFQAAIHAFEQALDEVPTHAPAREGLATLYRLELQRADGRDDDFNRVYFEGLMNQYDDQAKSDGLLSLHTIPDNANVTLISLESQHQRLIPIRTEQLGKTPIKDVPLAAGSYLAEITLEPHKSLTLPIRVRIGEHFQTTVSLRPIFDLSESEVFVPAGKALLGGNETSSMGLQVQDVYVDDFVIQKYPITFEEYLIFLHHVFGEDPHSAFHLLPRSADSVPLWDWDGGQIVPDRISLWGTRQEVIKLPAFGINVRCAESYAKWLSEQSGLTYRLPTEFEWEKAARGVDGRHYPWGRQFDACFCKMRESRSGPARPEPPGSFPIDVSPYGMFDAAGGIAEWVIPNHESTHLTKTQPQRFASRGGAWCDWRSDCHLAARRLYFAEEHSSRIGFRLVRIPLIYPNISNELPMILDQMF
jgi:eukaryotic-like serine/threonine-protein kinase